MGEMVVTYDVIAFGEALWDLLPTGARLGGAPLNFAYRMNSLGRRSAMVTRLGVDDLGDRAAATIVSLGLSGDFVQRDPDCPTGTVPVTLAADGSAHYEILHDVAYDHITISDDLVELASSASCICFGTLAQRASESRATLDAMLRKSAGAERVCDINLRKDCYSADVLECSLSRSTVLKLNDEEVAVVAGLFGMPTATILEFCLAALERWELTLCLVTLGARGSLAVNRDQAVYTPGSVVEVVDTIGAGDAFTAGFMHRYLAGDSLADCGSFGNALGSLVAATPGATTPVSLREIEAQINRAGPRIVDPEIAAQAR